MKLLRLYITASIVGILALLALFTLYAWLRNNPEDLPWTKLDLSQRVGLFTGQKLAALSGDFGECRALLREGGVGFETLLAVEGGENCGYSNGLRLPPGKIRRIGFAPDTPPVACPLAAALAVWEWNVVQPAAQRIFGKNVVRIEHLGSYNCRKIAGRESWSQHARANALDIAGFRLSDGTRISVLGDWKRGGDKARFLREVRSGACRLFSTTLSPEYNAAHRDHLHLDMGKWGRVGWRICR